MRGVPALFGRPCCAAACRRRLPPMLATQDQSEPRSHCCCFHLVQREEAAEFFNRTSAGGAITLISSLFMALLFFSELRESRLLPLLAAAALSGAALPIARFHAAHFRAGVGFVGLLLPRALLGAVCAADGVPLNGRCGQLLQLCSSARLPAAWPAGAMKCSCGELSTWWSAKM